MGLIAVYCVSATAQLSGPLSGTLGPGTFTVVGDISVQSGDSLLIAPGTELNFTGYYVFEINGYLRAVGFENDSIKFQPIHPDSVWGGIGFNNSADDSSRLSYCLITGSDNYVGPSNGGISCIHSSPSIVNCTISGNTGDYDGGGISCLENSNPTIENCTISGNSANDGGGIFCYENSSPSIVNCTITGNTATGFYANGGGIFCMNNSSPSIVNCTISGNMTDGWGGGIFCENSSPSFINCLIRGNTAAGGGGGISCMAYSDLTIDNCTISGNSANNGGGISCYDANPSGVNNIIWANSPIYPQISINGVSSFSCTYSDIMGGWSGTGNIDLYPGFVDTANGDYHLQSTVGSYHGGSWLLDSLHSPCIDVGDSTSSYENEPEPNGDRVNMGAYGNTVEASLSVIAYAGDPSIPIPRKFRLYQNYPNPFNASTVLRYSLPQPGSVNLTIYNIVGQHITTLFEGSQQAGHHTITWNASEVSSGIYFAQLQSYDKVKCIKMVLMK